MSTASNKRKQCLAYQRTSATDERMMVKYTVAPYLELVDTLCLIQFLMLNNADENSLCPTLGEKLGISTPHHTTPNHARNGR